MPISSSRRRPCLLLARTAGALALVTALTTAPAQEYQCLVEPYAKVGVSSPVQGVLDEVLASANLRTLGVLGVIGPTRIAYEQVIPVVDITAKLLTSALNSQK